MDVPDDDGLDVLHRTCDGQARQSRTVLALRQDEHHPAWRSALPACIDDLIERTAPIGREHDLPQGWQRPRVDARRRPEPVLGAERAEAHVLRGGVVGRGT